MSYIFDSGKLNAKRGAVLGFGISSVLTGIFFVTHPEMRNLPLEEIISSSVLGVSVTTVGIASTGYLIEKANKYFSNY